MKLLVTGGCGFMGSNFIRHWLEKNPADRIINLDKLTYAGHLSSTQDFSANSRYRFVKGNICNCHLVESLMSEVDVVVNFAAETHVDRAIAGSADFILTNVLGTQILLAAAVRQKIKRFHHVSTDEVFGSLPISSPRKFSEKTPYAPHNPYAATKAASNHLVNSYFQTYGLPVTITTASNNYGPFQDPEKFIPRLITNVIDHKKIPLYGNGKNVRDWLYVDDHSRALELVIKKGQIGKTYLVGGLNKKISNLEVATRILKIFGQNKSLIEFVPDRPGHDLRYAVDWSLIKKDLGWRPKYDFRTWLEKTADWYKVNGWWWRPLKARAEKFYSGVTR